MAKQPDSDPDIVAPPATKHDDAFVVELTGLFRSDAEDFAVIVSEASSVRRA